MPFFVLISASNMVKKRSRAALFQTVFGGEGGASRAGEEHVDFVGKK
jgi:hypothetical protein